MLASALRAMLADTPSGRAAVVTSIRNATDLSKVEAEALAQHLEVDGIGLLPQ
ncbi:hypothetical protein [Leucobacter sp. cx-169]|uniref:hypothetical protein n=1 Tax=Leucobacter sp. cx-169 TaxID=2770549 RepID=UPI00165E7745|nr:hypothetical protein [Leucobacter sp. cx-169]MBC9927197.1 hypothetical protein [Leucobacter sp. cx-169]